MTDPAASPMSAAMTTPAPPALAAAPTRRHAGGRPRRRMVRAVDARSVARVSLVFYACLVAGLLVAGAVVWIVAAAAGVVGKVESVVGDLFALDDFRFEPLRVLLVALLAGVVFALLGTAANVFAVLVFNRVARFSGGIEVTVVDDAPAEPARRSVL